MLTSICDVCDGIFENDQIVNCDGQRMCEYCAKDLGCEECTICGNWDECDGGMCYDCLGEL